MSGAGFDPGLLDDPNDPAPAGGEPTPAGPPPAGGEPEPTPEDLVEIRNREYEAAVERPYFEEFAARLRLDPDKLRQAIQIGLDGTRLYEQVNEERDRLTQAWDELRHAAPREPERRPAARPSAYGPPAYEPPAPPRRPDEAGPRPIAPRPDPRDVVGTVHWLADTFQGILPHLERIPTIEDRLGRTSEEIQEDRFQRDIAEERAVAYDAYEEVAEQWKREKRVLPPRRELEQALRRIPLSDDTDLTWHDIWNNMGWMIGGRSLYDQARRRAVLDSQKPGARMTVPASGPAGGAPSRVAGASANGMDQEALDAEAADLERQLAGVPTGVILPQG